jgi:hypothetical protein
MQQHGAQCHCSRNNDEKQITHLPSTLFFFPVLGIQLRILHLLGKHSTTWAMFENYGVFFLQWMWLKFIRKGKECPFDTLKVYSLEWEWKWPRILSLTIWEVYFGTHTYTLCELVFLSFFFFCLHIPLVKV